LSLHVEHLGFKLKRKTILEDINFDAKSSQVRVIIGPNGAGKTTLLKAIAQINKKSFGGLSVDGTHLGSLKTAELSKIISYMPQFLEVPDLSVLEVLELGRYTFSGFKIKQKDRVVIDDIIERFSLSSILEKRIPTLSGGERQKVLLASSLTQEPKVLLLDEPISHLDPKNQLEVLRVIKKLTIDKKIITLIVLHDIQHALHYGDKLLMMKNGKVAYDLDEKEIKEHHLSTVFDVDVKLFREKNHTFVYYAHTHTH